MSEQQSLGWVPTIEQLEAIDWLATGYSVTATARGLNLFEKDVSGWLNDELFSPEFRIRVASRTADFQSARDAVHDQQVVMALSIIQEALQGEIRRDLGAKGAPVPVRLEVALKLLSASFWPKKAAERQRRLEGSAD